jgi:hypothetical protein
LIALPSGVRVYIACGVTDMRKGMVGLAMLVQQGLGADPFDGAVYAFRGRRAGLIKLIWHDGIGHQAVGAGSVCVAVGDVHRADCALGGATGGPAGWVRMAGAGRAAPARAGGLNGRIFG